MAKPAKEARMERRGLIPWKPFAEMSRWERDMERRFENFFSRRAEDKWWPGEGFAMRELSLDLDLYEEKDRIVVKAELPGMIKDDIQISIKDNILTIKDEKKKKEKEAAKDHDR